MTKTIRHTWKPIEDKRFKHSKCPKCRCEVYHTGDRMIYIDRYGNTFYRVPECVMPNTRL